MGNILKRENRLPISLFAVGIALCGIAGWQSQNTRSGAEKAMEPITVKMEESGKEALSPVEVPKTKAEDQTLPRTEIVLSPLQKAQSLIVKALPSQAEREELHRLLQDRKLIQQSTRTLMDLSKRAMTNAAQKERMDSVEFLDAAVRWKDNPNRTQAMEGVLSILSRNVEKLSAPLALRRSVAGDAVELYTTLKREDPTRAKDLYASAEPEQQKLFDYSDGLFEGGSR